ncbi:MAG: methyltransferase domain-containing protein [Rubrivivax sp.]
MNSTHDSFEQARSCFLVGLEHLQAGRLADAGQCFSDALALAPGRPSVLANLGAVRRMQQRPAEALPVYDALVQAEPEVASGWLHRAQVLVALQRHAEALADLECCLRLDPDLAPAWALQGSLLRLVGRSEAAAEALERALALGHDDAQLRWFLASVSPHHAAPPAAPADYVCSLFDGYADDFEQHLVQTLHYRVPERLVAPLAGWHAGRFEAALDLGCGTGLCAPLLAPLATPLDGVDLSARMVEKAQARGLYRQVLQADLVQHLQSTEQRYALVVAADVFIYLGDLAAAFAGVQRVLQPGGLFALSLEQAGGEVQDFELRPSLTYGHAAAYVRRLAATQGFELLDLRADTLREDQGQPVPGWLAWLRRA